MITQMRININKNMKAYLIGFSSKKLDDFKTTLISHSANVNSIQVEWRLCCTPKT